ncbi:hypothetical protein JCM10450v2_001926 [Rhodotorula kratochvilovae]
MGQVTSATPPLSGSKERPIAPNLPHEILCAIIRLSVPPFGPTKLEIRRRERALRRCALVNPGWHAAALDEAVSAVFINTHGNGWSQDEATATRRIREARAHAEEHGRGIKTLDLFGEKDLPDASVQVMFAEFDKLEDMTLMKMRRPRLLIGSKPLRQLHIIKVKTPMVTGVYTNLTRLEIVDCCGELLPSSLTDVNFPSLDTLVLDLRKARLGFPEHAGYDPVRGHRPPNVRAVAVCGEHYAFMPTLLSALPRLQHLHLGISLLGVAGLLGALAHPPTSLSIEHGAADHFLLFSLSHPPLDPSTAAHAFSIAFLARLKLSLVHAESVEVRLWLEDFMRIVWNGAAQRGAGFEGLWTNTPFKPLEWDPVHDPSFQPISLEDL